MTMLVRGFSQVESRSDNGVEVEMTPGGGTLVFRTRDVSLVASTFDLVHALFGVAHPTVEDVDTLIGLLAPVPGQGELVETLQVFKANLTACLRENDDLRLS